MNCLSHRELLTPRTYAKANEEAQLVKNYATTLQSENGKEEDKEKRLKEFIQQHHNQKFPPYTSLIDHTFGGDAAVHGKANVTQRVLLRGFEFASGVEEVAQLVLEKMRSVGTHLHSVAQTLHHIYFEDNTKGWRFRLDF